MTMKLKASYIFLLFTILLCAGASAQVDRRIGSNQYKNSRKQEKKDFVDESVKYLTKELSLDDFQKAAVKTIMEDERSAIDAINEAPDMTTDERREKVSAISARVYKKILPLLSKEQGEKFTKMEEAKKF
jgi:hypothetical protein